jgi:putative RecB family exonuclease
VAVELPRALSPSRAGDFQTCPLLFRFRSIDRLPEPPSLAAVRGTLVHAALERMFDLPADDRTPATTVELLEPEWQRMLEHDRDAAALVDQDGDGAATLLTTSAELVRRYFTMEDPRALEPAHREGLVETQVDDLVLRGYVDRLDVASTGELRIVDYKTGKAPPEVGEAKALFQMRFYGLVVWRRDGVVPFELKLMYLGDGRSLAIRPDADSLEATQRKVQAIWRAIGDAVERRRFEPRTGPLCRFCPHQALCPAFGGQAPELPEITLTAARTKRRPVVEPPEAS